jgi:hypothetical protein
MFLQMGHSSGVYAVAVRDVELYLFLRVRRNPRGEVFVMFPRDEKRWDRHSSFHADGTHHQKSYDHKFLVQSGEKPTPEMRETRNVVTTGIASGEARAINTLCKPEGYAEIFEIAETQIRPENTGPTFQWISHHRTGRSSLIASEFSSTTLSKMQFPGS